MLTSLFRRLQVRAEHLRARPRRTFRPRLEALEERTALSTLTVLNASDHDPGSLRAALAAASSGDQIVFDPALNGQTITLTSGELLNTNLTITGPGAGLLTVSGNHASRVFEVASDTTVSLSGLTISNGNNSLLGVPSDGWGGGILNHGTLTLSTAIVSDNVSDAGGGAGSDFGGGIYNDGTLTVQDSTITGNTAVSNATKTGWGGGIYNVPAQVFQGHYVARGGILTVSNSTISANHATLGGGISNNPVLGVTGDGRGRATILNSTISGNGAPRDGGGIYNSGTVDMRNTIVAGNAGSFTAPDLSGGLASSVSNLIGGNPRLGPLQDNGGPTPTMALLPGSPALNAGDPSQLGVADQRGVVRSGGVNIGAYQASASALVVTAPGTVTAGAPFDVTVQAVDPFGQVAVGYVGTVTFTTSDPNPAAALPGDYPFTAADAGVHTFAGGATLAGAGGQTLTATDTILSSLSGSAPVAVSAAAADHFVLAVPGGVAAGTAFDVTITVVNAYGNTVSGYTGTVTFGTTDTDPGVVLPADYTFQAGDSGSHTFAAGVTLITPGDQTVTATDPADGLTGSVTVQL